MMLSRYAPTAIALLVFVAAPAAAYEKGTFVLRAGVTAVDPKINSYSMSESTPTDRSSTFVDVRSATSMSLTGTFLFSEHWGIDLLLALPFRHDIDAYVSRPSPVPGEPGFIFDGKIGETEQLPPTLSLQYHFSPGTSLQPYVGLGINWTRFSDTRYTGLFEDIIGEPVSELILEDSTGIAVQVGGDWRVGERTVINFDVRWIDIDTDVSIDGPNFDGEQKLFTAEIDPWVWSLSLGVHF